MSRAKKRPPTGDEPKHKWQCPAGHHSWERVNSHVWCHGCSRELAGGADDVDPEWQELLNSETGERDCVEHLVENVWPDFSQVSAY
jgi:ribosomal protein L37AE/L43A